MALVHILNTGYVGERVASTVSLIEAGDSLVVVDPGMVSSRSAILDPIAAFGYDAGEITDVVVSHHHPDHTMNITLFPNANVHDHWAVYKDDLWTSRPAEGFEVAEGVTLWETPGHTPQDITTVARGADGVAALTHLWWHSEGPLEDPYATDSAALHAGRERVLEIATLIVPGHGSPFAPDVDTPR